MMLYKLAMAALVGSFCAGQSYYFFKTEQWEFAFGVGALAALNFSYALWICFKGE